MKRIKRATNKIPSINRRTDNKYQEQKPLEKIVDSEEAKASTDTFIDKIDGQKTPSSTDKEKHSALPKTRVPRRRVVGTAKNEIQLIRVQLNKETFACSLSVEMWVLINSNYSKGFQKEKIFNVAPELVDSLSEHVRPIKVQLVIDKDGVYSVLYTKLTDGFSNSWMESAEACSAQLEQGWGRVISDKVNQEYIFLPDNSGRPIPDINSFPDIEKKINKVFANSTITSLSDPVLEEMGIYIDPDLAA